MQIVPIFISGVVGAACSVAFSYGVASLPCGLVSKGADSVCQVRSFGKAVDSWKFGFIVGGLVGWEQRDFVRSGKNQAFAKTDICA
ncbi:hypothetical protein VF14_22095 [Nostoc linckia z18]|uniref:Uncharacterized protein n=2 Tax=Nostoc linckia TaxID=92942 RepID=A0A9Q5Z9W6_NOSLI|nr:hypothetical protein VF02_30905 [Nostoc linckia z1]PHJ59518.1 hypothetical protein VF05_32095 [Nostoc linckia z3]PHJ64106.1 hypothetical protein VF03_29600 [Nostoc linckia z2]PHJ75851.1 hypothetical protein VF06_32635 [Nostoc linckia z4]PHJ80717.1 hypothetical protein VF07_31700 [Nostoc linckia z6]PHJ94048.1 hypothetical protein VF04_23660 [Nostoc linckia z7]PHK01695.1 hypothetical protein VF08_21285 [Nostoc linckia z8]PHK08387.1 hypothetical protein VF09_19920 [Nostoc linckia z9]PHK1858